MMMCPYCKKWPHDNRCPAIKPPSEDLVCKRCSCWGHADNCRERYKEVPTIDAFQVPEDLGELN